MVIDPARRPQQRYFQRGTQTEPPPLPEQAAPPLRSKACSCPCPCSGELPVNNAEPQSSTSISDRSMLGSHPPRLSRLTNRVVSLPELVEEAPFIQPRVASMPTYFPPVFSEDFEDYGFKLLPSQGCSGSQYSLRPDQRAYMLPRTPSPAPVPRRGLGVFEYAAKEYALYGEHEPQNWITWASSPPKPIPALHGPLSLPYARCPSGAEGTVIESDDRVSNMIWGLESSQSAGRTQSDKNSTSGHEVQLVLPIGPPAGDSLNLAAERLSKQLKGLTLTCGSSSHEFPSQLSGLGLHVNVAAPAAFHKKDHTHISEAKSLKPEAFTTIANGRVSSLRAASSVDNPKPVSASQLPTPPMSTSTHWTPHLPSNLVGDGFSPLIGVTASRGLSPALGFSGLRYLHPGDHVLDRYTNAQEWQNYPNSNAQHLDYSFDSESTILGSGFNPYEQSPQQEPSHFESARFKEKRQTPFKHEYRLSLSGQEAKHMPSTQMIHRRLPVLEEDSSFDGSPRGFGSHRVQLSVSDAGNKVVRKFQASGGRCRSAASGSQRQPDSPSDRKVDAGSTKATSTCNAPQRRWKPKRNV